MPSTDVRNRLLRTLTNPPPDVKVWLSHVAPPCRCSPRSGSGSPSQVLTSLRSQEGAFGQHMAQFGPQPSVGGLVAAPLIRCYAATLPNDPSSSSRSRLTLPLTLTWPRLPVMGCQPVSQPVSTPPAPHPHAGQPWTLTHALAWHAMPCHGQGARQMGFGVSASVHVAAFDHNGQVSNQLMARGGGGGGTYMRCKRRSPGGIAAPGATPLLDGRDPFSHAGAGTELAEGQ